MGSNICQKPDANEINGTAKITSLLITTAIIAHQSIKILEESWTFGEKGESTNQNREKKLILFS